MRKAFDRAIMDLLNDVNSMGTRVDRILGDTLKALIEQDFVLSKQIYENDYKINNMETAIEQSAISLIALQQPVATDLRRITACLKVVTDIERIGDQCADVCEVMNSNPNFHQVEVPTKVVRQFEKAKEMFVASMESFMQMDEETAKDVISQDDVVDDLFVQIVLDMTTKIEENTKFKSQAVDYMFISKYIERIADHATNIGEWAIYAVTGEHKSYDPLEADDFDDEEDDLLN